jgi:predicted nucleic acid-binding protein
MTATSFFDTNILRFYDAAILAAAQQLGCQTLYSEDLNHGQTYDTVQVINPFL